MDQLQFRRSICNLYYRRYAANRSPVGRPLGRPQPMTARVPQELRLDGANHIIESSAMQR
jgi:hypothetical protein